MEVKQYQPNSHRSKTEGSTEVAKTEEKKIQKVVSGKVKTKTNDKRKLANLFISEDISNVKSFVFMDVLVPAIKKAISDIVTDGIDMILYGGKGGGSKHKSGNKVSYRSYYDDKRDDRRDDGYRAKSRFDYDDIIFDSRGDAEAVREQMTGSIERFGLVTVADMYDMADLPAPYTSNRYGWTNIRTAETVRVRDGFTLKLPKAMPID